MQEYLWSMYKKTVYEWAKENWPRKGDEEFREAIQKADHQIEQGEGLDYTGLLDYVDVRDDRERRVGFESFVMGLLVGLELAPYTLE